LPHRIEPIAESFIRALEQLAAAAGAAFDLSSTQSESEELRKVARQLDQMPRPSDPEAVAALNGLLLRQTHRLNAALYTRAGRFDQDPAAPIPILPLLARVRELAALDPESDLHGFLETELIRGRNEVDAVLREARREIQTFLANR
jgi:hypothetical protein